ncbi:MAG: DUF3253 domain-containing protein, partial [Tagaea sp.]
DGEQHQLHHAKGHDHPNRQRMLPRARQSAIDLARLGAIEILRKGKPVDDPETAKGVLRYRVKA